jgi:hypothetical protein
MSENNDKFKPTVEWMAKMYAKFNKELFWGELGACDFGIFTSGRGSQGKVLGWFSTQSSRVRIKRGTRQMFLDGSWDRITITKNNFVQYFRPIIKMNGNYSGTEDSLSATLVHEMCHYYNYMYGYAPGRAHGREFMEIASIVSSKSGGRFTIQRVASAEEMRGYELDKEIAEKNKQRFESRHSDVTAVFVYNENGDVELTITKSQSVIDDIVSSSARHFQKPDLRGRKPIKVVASNDKGVIDKLIMLGYRRVMRTYRYWSITNDAIKQMPNESNSNVLWQASGTKNNNTDESMNRIERIISEQIASFLDEEFGDGSEDIALTPGENLGVMSPLEDEL